MNHGVRDYICFLVFLLLLNMPLTALANDTNGYFDSLQDRLIEDGFNAAWIKKIYARRSVSFEPRRIAAYFVHSEATLDYDQFTSEDSIARARKYMEDHKEDLESAEKEYGVEKEMITAIILVETRLGAYVGRSPTLNTLSSMAALADLWVRGEFWDMDIFPEDDKPDRKKFEKKAYRKSDWAYTELKAFLAYVWQEGMDPVKIKGSMAGALGLAQFMPTNIPAYARDGNGDGSIDLFHHADSIASVANFLRNFGWEKGISRRKAKKVIHYYNHSEYYVDAILKVFELLKG